MKPAQQRSSTHGDYRVASFGSTGLAANSYALDMNTSSAYREFRLKRAELRRQNRLDPAADAYLRDMAVIHVVPVD